MKKLSMDSAVEIDFGGQRFLADLRRALYWPARDTLVLADMHIGKARDFSSRGTLLPPYEMKDMRLRLESLIADYAPTRIIALGDSFHRKDSVTFLENDDRSLLDDLMNKVSEWIFVEGNHDAGGFSEWTAVSELNESGLILCHQPKENASPEVPTIVGHFHPKFSRNVAQVGNVTKPCYIWDDRLLILPAFGTYTGGLDVKHIAISKFFESEYHIATADTLPRPALFTLSNKSLNQRAR